MQLEHQRPTALPAVQPPVAVLLRRDNVRRVRATSRRNALFTALKLDCVTKSYVEWSHYLENSDPRPAHEPKLVLCEIGAGLIATMLARNFSIAARCLIPKK
jgi:hypothetical protein